jgi:DNA-binding MarR family transcriptional regulator
MNTLNEDIRDLDILEQIEENPDITQASLADQMGVAVGTVNFLIKRLIEKGYVKVKRAQRKKLRYIITPKGISHRARLTVNYVEHSLRLYRKTRTRIAILLTQIKEAGYTQVYVEPTKHDPEDIMDICRLTCLEHGIQIIENPANVPALKLSGFKVTLDMPEARI